MDGPTEQTNSVGEANEKQKEVAELAEESLTQKGRPAEDGAKAEEDGAKEEEDGEEEEKCANEETCLEVSARRIQALKRKW